MNTSYVYRALRPAAFAFPIGRVATGRNGQDFLSIFFSRGRDIMAFGMLLLYHTMLVYIIICRDDLLHHRYVYVMIILS